MDGRHSDQQYSSSNLSQVNATYSYNVPQPDPFNAFVNTDDAPGFDSNWADQTFQNQPSIGHYEQTNHGWQADSYQNSSLLAAQNYASPSREFDQNYVREPATFNNYPDFEQTPVQPYATPAYDSAAAYEQIPISDRFDFPSNRRYGQSNEITISPQALQAYPTAGKAGSQPSGPVSSNLHLLVYQEYSLPSRIRPMPMSGMTPGLSIGSLSYSLSIVKTGPKLVLIRRPRFQ